METQRLSSRDASSFTVSFDMETRMVESSWRETEVIGDEFESVLHCQILTSHITT